MCWLAANKTRSPCFALFTAFAIAPMPIMSGDSKSAIPSSVVSRSPTSTLSAITPNEGSLMSVRSRAMGAGISVSLPHAAHGERHVVSAESEAVAERDLHVATHRAIGRVVEIQLGIRVLVVDRRRNDAVAHRQSADDELHGSRGAEHVAG